MLHIYPKVHLHSMRKGTILYTSQSPTVVPVFNYSPKILMVTSNSGSFEAVTDIYIKCSQALSEMFNKQHSETVDRPSKVGIGTKKHPSDSRNTKPTIST